MGYNKDVIIFNAYIFAISIFYVAERFSDSTRNQNCCFQHAINILLYWIGNLLLARVYIQELYAADFAADYYYIRTGLWLVSLPTYVLLSFAFILPLVEVNGCSTRSVEGRDICYYSPDSTIASNFLELITGITLVFNIASVVPCSMVACMIACTHHRLCQLFSSPLFGTHSMVYGAVVML